MTGTAVVTGANSGIGLALGVALATEGWEVVLACRSCERGRTALEQVATHATGPEPRFVQLDLSNRGSFARVVSDIEAHTSSLDALVNNAGVMSSDRTTGDGQELHFATNHLGPFALTGQLLPLLHRSASPRVVTISSLGHWWGRQSWRSGMPATTGSGFRRYCDSKLANLLFAFELDRRAKDANSALVSVAAHPGMTHSNLSTGYAGLKGRATAWLQQTLGQDVHIGALPAFEAATRRDLAGAEYLGPGGLLGARGRPTLARASRRAHEVVLATELWSLSERVTDQCYDWSSVVPPASSS